MVEDIFFFFCSLRILLHKPYNAELLGGGQSGESSLDELEDSKTLIWDIIKESLAALEKASYVPSARFVRWELGSCWLQHLQKKETPGENRSKSIDAGDEAEQAVKGLGEHFKLLKKRDRKPNINTGDRDENDSNTMGTDSGLGDQTNGNPEHEAELKKLISEEAFLRLKQTGTGLHSKVCIFKQLVQVSLKIIPLITNCLA